MNSGSYTGKAKDSYIKNNGGGGLAFSGGLSGGLDEILSGKSDELEDKGRERIELGNKKKSYKNLHSHSKDPH